MCVERLQRLMMAFMLGLILALAWSGFSEIAVILQAFVIVMILIWAVTNFCPSIWTLRKLVPPCQWEK
jgi:hypothetical protein